VIPRKFWQEPYDEGKDHEESIKKTIALRHFGPRLENEIVPLSVSVGYQPGQ
jgi:hypothetical protein